MKIFAKIEWKDEDIKMKILFTSGEQERGAAGGGSSGGRGRNIGALQLYDSCNENQCLHTGGIYFRK